MRALPVTVAIAANAHRQCVTKSVVEAIVYYVPTTGQSERQPLSYSWL